MVRASGGVIFYSDADATTGVSLAAGGGAWDTVSDANLKRDFLSPDPGEVLTRLMQVPVRTWSYKSQDASIRHIGPTAQDFAEAFGLGASNRSISTIDADGVALASIQGLYQLVQEKDTEIARLERRLAVLEEQMLELSNQP